MTTQDSKIEARIAALLAGEGRAERIARLDQVCNAGSGQEFRDSGDTTAQWQIDTDQRLAVLLYEHTAQRYLDRRIAAYTSYENGKGPLTAEMYSDYLIQVHTDLYVYDARIDEESEIRNDLYDEYVRRAYYASRELSLRLCVLVDKRQKQWSRFVDCKDKLVNRIKGEKVNSVEAPPEIEASQIVRNTRQLIAKLNAEILGI